MDQVEQAMAQLVIDELFQGHRAAGNVCFIAAVKPYFPPIIRLYWHLSAADAEVGLLVQRRATAHGIPVAGGDRLAVVLLLRGDIVDELQDPELAQAVFRNHAAVGEGVGDEIVDIMRQAIVDVWALASSWTRPRICIQEKRQRSQQERRLGLTVRTPNEHA